MGCRLRRSNHLTKCHVLCWHDGLSRTARTNQSGVPQWGTREKFPSTVLLSNEGLSQGQWRIDSRLLSHRGTVHVASDRALLQKELVIAQVWSRSYVRKTKSRKERGSAMLGRLTRMIEGDLPNGLGRAA